MLAIINVLEHERTHFANELHDGLGSSLSTIKHLLESTEANNEMNGRAQYLLNEASKQVRRISQNMTSNALNKFGLSVAVQDLAQMLSYSSFIKVQVIISGIKGRLNNSQEINLFRILQELISNFIKHSKASKASIQLTQHKKSINLIVEDNGIGFDLGKFEEKGGFGLPNLYARIEYLHGSVYFDSGKGNGTTVIVDIPINESF